MISGRIPGVVMTIAIALQGCSAARHAVEDDLLLRRAYARIIEDPAARAYLGTRDAVGLTMCESLKSANIVSDDFSPYACVDTDSSERADDDGALLEREPAASDGYRRILLGRPRWRSDRSQALLTALVVATSREGWNGCDTRTEDSTLVYLFAFDGEGRVVRFCRSPLIVEEP